VRKVVKSGFFLLILQILLEKVWSQAKRNEHQQIFFTIKSVWLIIVF